MDYYTIDKLLKEKGMSRRTLANLIGVGASTVSMWFTRQTKHVPVKHIKSIANVLGVPYWELYTVEDGEFDISVVLDMMSEITEKQTGYSNEQLIMDFRRLSVDGQQYIVRRMKEIFEEEQAETQAAYEYYKGEEGNNGTGSERESQRNDHQG